VISITRLRDQLEGDRVVFDRWGHVVEVEVPEGIGPATLMVSPLTEAVKRVDEAERLVESVNRSGMWAVDAIVLSSVVLSRLEATGESMTAEELIDAVTEAGFAWQTSPTSVP
jgi:hypothetical protein